MPRSPGRRRSRVAERRLWQTTSPFADPAFAEILPLGIAQSWVIETVHFGLAYSRAPITHVASFRVQETRKLRALRGCVARPPDRRCRPERAPSCARQWPSAQLGLRRVPEPVTESSPNVLRLCRSRSGDRRHQSIAMTHGRCLHRPLLSTGSKALRRAWPKPVSRPSQGSCAGEGRVAKRPQPKTAMWVGVHGSRNRDLAAGGMPLGCRFRG
jgi:hypothetical protein